MGLKEAVDVLAVGLQVNANFMNLEFLVNLVALKVYAYFRLAYTKDKFVKDFCKV